MMRFKVTQRDVPPEYAAKRLGLSLAAFLEKLPNLVARGFPQVDPDTGNFDLEAMDRWCNARHQHLYSVDAPFGARDAKDVVAGRIAAMRAGRG